MTLSKILCKWKQDSVGDHGHNGCISIQRATGVEPLSAMIGLSL